MELTQSEQKAQAPAMFNRIAKRYDLLNHLLSGRRDVAWRKRMARYLPPGRDLSLIDIATGTADQIFSLLHESDRITKTVGIDLSEEMLAEGKRKVDSRCLGGRISLQLGDATHIPFEDASFDVATVSFGIRNVVDTPHALQEMFRVLKPNGRALILEFSLPYNSWIRIPYLFYFRHLLPRIGSLISGDSHAYRYLNRTVEDFPFGEKFAALMQKEGFSQVSMHPLTFGVATIYVGEKPL